jgi:hypothetical protein
VQEKKPLGRLHYFVLFILGERYFILSIVIQDANDKEAEIRILTQVLGYLYATLFRGDPSYVVGQFWIFAATFLNDGSSVFECHIDLSEPGEILSYEVLNFVGCRLFLGRGEVQYSLQSAKALAFVGYRFLLSGILLGRLDYLSFSGD